ncbi:MAG TPA: signal peptide peptidase SppA [Acidobacteriota bacterium]|nr:signal peptide peptidase SppA [Acidobacteriota bacterium]
MSRRTAIVLGIIVLVFVVVILAVVLMIHSFRKPPEVKADSVLVVRLQGEISDGPTTNPFEDLLGEGKDNVYDFRRAIDYATDDKRIRAVVVKLAPNSLGWAGAEELRGALQKFRKSGKPIHAFISTDFIEDRDYYVILPASRIVLNPEAGLLINGMYAEVTFFRKALDKLYIRPQYIQYKEYKSAAEQFTRTKMSPEFRESLEYVVRDIEDRFIQAVAADRKKTPDEVRAFMDRGLATAAEAKQQSYVDAIGHWSEEEDLVKQEVAASASTDGVKGKSGTQTAGSGSKEDKDKKDLHTISVKSYLKAVDEGESGKSKIGLVFAAGLISSGESDPFNDIMGGDTYAGYIRELRKDKSIKAIVLRVNSPGGSAVGSDVIWREVRAARAAGKPVVISMADVAASGGYYISMGADKIVVEPSTITGSIGVVFGKMDTRKFFDWLGITFDTIKTRKNSDIFSFIDLLTPEQEQRVRAWMSQVYNDFVSKTAEGRNKSFDEIEPLAHGRIWSGAQAKDRALVDVVGGLDEAVRQARQLAKIPAEDKVRFVVYPKKKTVFDLIFGGESPFARSAKTPLSFLDTPFFKSLQEPHLWMIAPDIRIH